MYENYQLTAREPNGRAAGAFGVFEQMSANPMFGPNTGVLYRMGAKDTAEIVRGGVPFRVRQSITQTHPLLANGARVRISLCRTHLWPTQHDISLRVWCCRITAPGVYSRRCGCTPG